MRRRDLIRAAALAPLLPVAAAAVPRNARLTIDGIELYRLPVNRRGDWLLLRLRTANGLTGIGDASHGGDDTATLRWLRQLFDRLRGRSVFDVTWLRQTTLQSLGRRADPPLLTAASALEQALWDLQGKALGVPVYDLFGGRLHERLRLYANINRSTDPRTPVGFAAMARRAVADGFTAVKLAPFDALPFDLADPLRRRALIDDGVACATAVRTAIGAGHDLLIDVHSRLRPDEGLALASRLQPLDLFWLEEVTPADPPIALAAINRAAAMPTAGGESIQGVAGFYPYVTAGAVDVLMPDVKQCGGMLELRKIAALGEGAGFDVAPHGPASPIGNLAAGHVAATLPNFTILEHAYGEVPWRAEVVDPPEQVTNGALTLANRPGLGADLDAATLRRKATSI
ncbi:mandelate racemase/muconate lactonizing enzyme family protein [uncultured Sphingomonas sp.]|uniref:mandelate racemase/muconate lactonizing enzyme family protein n=1 Tax=uncultured Sphingomonas sp. TaxID=158754 RepID=UPI0035CAA8E4